MRPILVPRHWLPLDVPLLELRDLLQRGEGVWLLGVEPRVCGRLVGQDDGHAVMQP